MSEGFLLERMTWPQAQAAFKRTTFVVVPTGSTEQHGPHLPLSTDTDLAVALQAPILWMESEHLLLFTRNRLGKLKRTHLGRPGRMFLPKRVALPCRRHQNTSQMGELFRPLNALRNG